MGSQAVPHSVDDLEGGGGDKVIGCGDEGVCEGEKPGQDTYDAGVMCAADMCCTAAGICIRAVVVLCRAVSCQCCDLPLYAHAVLRC